MELTEEEKDILRLGFKLIWDIINSIGSIEIKSCDYFDYNDLYHLAEKLGVEDY